MSIYGNAVGHPLPDPRKGMEMSGPINMNGQAIKGLNAPTADDEAVNWGRVKNAAGVGIPLPLGLEYGGVGATDPTTARENLEITPENIGALSMELLWENASPNSSMTAQSISFDKKSYKMFMVVDNNGTTAIIFDNGNGFISFYMSTAISFRQLTITKTGMTIGGAYLYWYGSSNTSADNNYNIIARVYGIGGVSA